jgi:hypothetical protein
VLMGGTFFWSLVATISSHHAPVTFWRWLHLLQINVFIDKTSGGKEPALQATLSEIPVGVRQPPLQAIHPTKRHLGPLDKELKHSKSFDYPASSSKQTLSSQSRLRRRRSFHEDSGDSSDPVRIKNIFHS